MPVVDHLRIILTNEEVEVIKATKIPQNQRRELIDILRRKDKRLLPFKRLLRALLSDRVGQEWLANEIQTAYNREDMDAEFGRVSNALQPVAAHNCDAWQK
uniref:CARD domain-containing protein n=1 Tax=Plectus sambesii TaxID=2011161 RepID=A0A914W029_9BILA